ncbi:MAG: hypothetical protein JSU08_01210 [Acidobacteria bacterium]|nr:hypothetical protein [Acidobacteriota bacterium]
MRVIKIALVALACACSGAGLAAQDRSTVRGTITVSGQRDLSGVAVWLQPLDRRTPAPAPSSRYTITQQNKRFAPHLLIVPTGSTVDFPNLDPFFHNVFSLFDGRRFDLGLYEAGGTRSVTFPRAGVSYIFCNIHPEMSAVVVVVDSPYFASTDRQGTFAFTQVPPGRYALRLWHDRLTAATGAVQKEIVVGAGDATLEAVALVPGDDKLSRHTNKFGLPYTPPPAGPTYK